MSELASSWQNGCFLPVSLPPFASFIILSIIWMPSGSLLVTVCRKDASLDEPDTLLSFQRSIDRSPHKRSHGVVLLVLDCASILHSLCLLQYIVLVYYYYTPKLSFVMYSPSLTRLWKGCGQVAQHGTKAEIYKAPMCLFRLRRLMVSLEVEHHPYQYISALFRSAKVVLRFSLQEYVEGRRCGKLYRT